MSLHRRYPSEAVVRQFLKRRRSDRWESLPRHEEKSLCHRLPHAIDLPALAQQPFLEQAVARAGGQQAFVDDPCVGLDIRASKVLLQSAGLRDRRGFGQRDKQDARVIRILKSGFCPIPSRPERLCRRMRRPLAPKRQARCSPRYSVEEGWLGARSGPSIKLTKPSLERQRIS